MPANIFVLIFCVIILLAQHVLRLFFDLLAEELCLELFLLPAFAINLLHHNLSSHSSGLLVLSITLIIKYFSDHVRCILLNSEFILGITHWVLLGHRIFSQFEVIFFSGIAVIDLLLFLNFRLLLIYLDFIGLNKPSDF